MMVSTRYDSSDILINAILHIFSTINTPLTTKAECCGASRSVMRRAETTKLDRCWGRQWPKCQLVVRKALSRICQATVAPNNPNILEHNLSDNFPVGESFSRNI